MADEALIPRPFQRECRLTPQDIGHATRLYAQITTDLGGEEECTAAERVLIELGALMVRLAQVAAQRQDWFTCMRALSQGRSTLVAVGLKRRSRVVGEVIPSIEALVAAHQSQHTYDVHKDAGGAPASPAVPPGTLPG